MALTKRLTFWYMLAGFVFLANLYFLMYLHKSSDSNYLDLEKGKAILGQLNRIEKELNQQVHLHESILRAVNGEEASLIANILGLYKSAPNKYRKYNSNITSKMKEDSLLLQNLFKPSVIPVVVIACNRVSISRNLDQLFKHRMLTNSTQFPIVVSQDCAHEQTSQVIQSYKDRLTHLKHPNQTPIKLPTAKMRFAGYYKIARHYKWALDQVFLELNHSVAIIVEDDLDIAPDFFEYFAATYPILQRDPSLWCVSAWNDNGKTDLISNDPQLLYRTDFFPGLGWMILRSTWVEIRDNWPETFWDEYMRKPYVRHDRSCIRPEISRSSTFGRKGVSNGQYFDKHLRYIKLNDRFVPFTHLDISYLEKTEFEALWHKRVYEQSKLVTLRDIQGHSVSASLSSVRVEYRTKVEFITIAKSLSVMEDFKAGVPRTAYMGVVTLMRQGLRIYIAPPSIWKGYDPSWM